MIQHFAAPVGSIRLVLYHDREDSRTCGRVSEITTGAENYALIRIPPKLWYGFRGLQAGESLVANCASILHDPREPKNLDLNTERIPYRWLGYARLK